jgi:hydrogenase maturation protein HypF
VTAVESAPQRLRVQIRGAVQGVGFRPFVYRLASDLDLRGWVINSSAGVVVEVEGGTDALERFLLLVARDRPPRAIVQGLESAYLDPVGFTGFEIRESAGGDKTTLVLPDIATCPECLAELFDPANRRHRYPFTNCTNCGPRFSIIEALPYDRPKTTMAGFDMCEACRNTRTRATAGSTRSPTPVPPADLAWRSGTPTGGRSPIATTRCGQPRRASWPAQSSP